MADLGALSEAQGLLSFSSDLLGLIEAAVGEAESVREEARDAIQRIEAAGRRGGDHVDWLGEAQREGGRMQEEAAASLAAAAAAGRAAWTAFSPAWLAVPTLASAAHRPAAGRSFVIPEPVPAAAPSAQELRRLPLPPRASLAALDLLAERVSTFEDIFARTRAALAEAEEALAEKPSARRRPAGLDGLQTEKGPHA